VASGETVRDFSHRMSVCTYKPGANLFTHPMTLTATVGIARFSALLGRFVNKRNQIVQTRKYDTLKPKSPK